MRTTVRLPAELLARAKRKAAAEGRTLTSLIEEGLRTIVSAKPAARRKPMVRVSRATGGLLPGIDPIKVATQCEEMDDLERLQRIDDRK